MEETKESQAPTVRTVGVRYGVIYGAIAIVYFLIFSLAGVDMSSGVVRWGSPAIAIIIVVIAHKYFKDNGDGYMAYGQGFGIGFWVGLISSAISSVFTYIYVKFIDSGFIENIRTKAIEDMQEQGQSEEQIEMASKFMNMFTSPEAIFGFGLIGGIITLMIIALIVTIFTQKARPQQTF